MVEQGRIVVLGLGVSGYAAADLAAHHAAQVTVLDVGDSPALRERAAMLCERGVRVHLEWPSDAWDEGADLVIVSPGIPPESLLGHLAAGFDCPAISELEYGFRHCPCPILAVTGTNGKTTTVELLVHCLNRAGIRAMAAGNIGKPLCEAARRSSLLDFLVVEVSSFQLERVDRFAPLAAAVLNVSPDHQDRYSSFEEYARTKLRLLANVTRRNRIVLRESLAETEAVQRALPQDDSQPVTFAAHESLFADYFLADDGVLCRRSAPATVRRLLPRTAIRLDGRHNVENVLAALALAQAAGIAPDELARHVATFAPAAHRLELVGVHRGVRFVNDSKATNPDALVQALATTAAAATGQILLIAGGLDKGLDFGSVAPLLAAHAKAVFLIGRCRERLAKQWFRVVSCKVFASLTAAVDAAADDACPGDTILLSPGCASQDMFTDYAERGREFCTLVKRRIKE